MPAFQPTHGRLSQEEVAKALRHERVIDRRTGDVQYVVISHSGVPPTLQQFKVPIPQGVSLTFYCKKGESTDDAKLRTGVDWNHIANTLLHSAAAVASNLVSEVLSYPDQCEPLYAFGAGSGQSQIAAGIYRFGFSEKNDTTSSQIASFPPGGTTLLKILKLVQTDRKAQNCPLTDTNIHWIGCRVYIPAPMDMT